MCNICRILHKEYRLIHKYLVQEVFLDVSEAVANWRPTAESKDNGESENYSVSETAPEGRSSKSTIDTPTLEMSKEAVGQTQFSPLSLGRAILDGIDAAAILGLLSSHVSDLPEPASSVLGTACDLTKVTVQSSSEPESVQTNPSHADMKESAVKKASYSSDPAQDESARTIAVPKDHHLQRESPSSQEEKKQLPDSSSPLFTALDAWAGCCSPRSGIKSNRVVRFLQPAVLERDEDTTLKVAALTKRIQPLGPLLCAEDLFAALLLLSGPSLSEYSLSYYYSEHQL